MPIYNVINVGQGDCIIIEPPDGCKYSSDKIIIDLGPGDRDVTKFIEETDALHIFITHHHKDHLGGLRFFIDRFKQIKEIIVPLYQNEITLIARAILNLKGINISRDCNEFINELKEIMRNQIELITLSRKEGLSPTISFAYENKELCNHMICLNPPKYINASDLVNKANENELKELMSELFTNSFAEEMAAFFRAQIRGNYDRISYPNFYNYWLSSQYDYERSVCLSKCNFVLSFIIDNLSLMRMFNTNSCRKNLNKIYTKYVEASHNVCIVLKTHYDNATMLHTSDASKKVFNRLIKEGRDISVKYLKMPHHGSKHNINKKILRAINPDVAIISHDNQHSGKSGDPHPNKETLKMLKENNITILVTNDVIKDNFTIEPSKYFQNKYLKVCK